VSQEFLTHLGKEELVLWQRFSEKVYELPFGCNEFHLTVSITHMISYEMVSDLNMFCPRVLNMIFCEINGTYVVTD